MELSIPVPVPELPNVIPAHPCLLLDVFYKICLQLVTGDILQDKTAFGDQEGLQIHENR